ncbi:glycerol kinase GlpK [bacterium]|nr:glycerol kinase GlpK [bacterium]
MEKYVLSLDQGTTSSRAIVFDKKGEIRGVAQQEFTQIYPKPGWVEHDPTEILSSEMASVQQALIRAGITIENIDSIGITNQRETTILWDKKTGKPLYNAIVWQCRRTEEKVKAMLQKDPSLDEMVYDKTGLKLDPYFSASKIEWILDNVEGAREKALKGEVLFGTVDTYLLWHLTGRKVHATDHTNASRTLLFNIHTLTWDEDLLKLFNIPKSILPEVHPSSYEYGFTEVSLLGKKVPITGIVGDQQGSLFGQLCVKNGDVKNTFGTGCFLLMNTGDKPIKSNHGLLTTLAASLDDKPQYVLEGSVFIGGATVKWLMEEMHLLNTPAESEKYANKCTDTDGVYFVPAFTGLGAPYWDGDARGIVTGLTRGTTKEQFIRAGLEGIAYQVYDVLKAMENDLGIDIRTLCVDGGVCKNNFIMQFESNILKAEVKRPKVIEVTALGAAYLAGIKTGYWKDIEDISKNKEIERYFFPQMDDEERTKKIHGWHLAVKRAMLHD